jgi:hypothetical protein
LQQLSIFRPYKAYFLNLNIFAINIFAALQLKKVRVISTTMVEQELNIGYQAI